MMKARDQQNGSDKIPALDYNRGFGLLRVIEETAAEEVESVYRTNRRRDISHGEENPYEI
jgi:hypothetical protein